MKYTVYLTNCYSRLRGNPEPDRFLTLVEVGVNLTWSLLQPFANRINLEMEKAGFRWIKLQ